MMTIVRADKKRRLCIRQAEPGQEYLVKMESGGWWVMPAPEVRPAKGRRSWNGSKLSLGEHLQGLADSGLVVEVSEAAKEKAGRCLF